MKTNKGGNINLEGKINVKKIIYLIQMQVMKQKNYLNISVEFMEITFFQGNKNPIGKHPQMMS